jgi:exodeoxyribonuclease-3
MRILQQPQFDWIVPIKVEAPTPFTLIAVWACRMGSGRTNSYIGLVYQALMSHPEWFDGTPVILAGDLNSNKIWDGKRLVGNHSDVVKVLAERGLVSVYHDFYGEAQGAETRHTLYLFRHAHRPYHIDYVFMPLEWAKDLKTVDVGEYAQWSKLSDHCPLTVDIAEVGPS